MKRKNIIVTKKVGCPKCTEAEMIIRNTKNTNNFNQITVLDKNWKLTPAGKKLKKEAEVKGIKLDFNSAPIFYCADFSCVSYGTPGPRGLEDIKRTNKKNLQKNKEIKKMERSKPIKLSLIHI